MKEKNEIESTADFFHFIQLCIKQYCENNMVVSGTDSFDVNNETWFFQDLDTDHEYMVIIERLNNVEGEQDESTAR